MGERENTPRVERGSGRPCVICVAPSGHVLSGRPAGRLHRPRDRHVRSGHRAACPPSDHWRTDEVSNAGRLDRDRGDRAVCHYIQELWAGDGEVSRTRSHRHRGAFRKWARVLFESASSWTAEDEDGDAVSEASRYGSGEAESHAGRSGQNVTSSTDWSPIEHTETPVSMTHDGHSALVTRCPCPTAHKHMLIQIRQKTSHNGRATHKKIGHEWAGLDAKIHLTKSEKLAA